MPACLENVARDCVEILTDEETVSFPLPVSHHRRR